MKKQHFILGTIALSLSVLASCSKNDNDKAAPVKPAIVSTTVVNLDADAANKGTFTLYSLADNKIIPNSDSATTKWDIGFKATTLIINGGSSGPGKATAQVVTGIYNNLTLAPEDGYVTDATAKKAITGWYSYNMTTHIISPVTGAFIVLKTANGNYAKLEISSYYKDAPATPTETAVSRHYNFRYVYQPDGTRNFK
ncbi:heme-binding HmuY-like protein [Chitinophaga niastensis]|uniref:Heme-binding HmuY-like protein n=1 Tax=Chitinophaga niastensis TaxID=536980 RepID=A0A2P8HNP4_CHINA|nr:HmuY family protein [Chitinophaga niastensis]PSL47844.1 heme-binding HmuY-like protein [Chitinophaga niastensis]